MVLQGPCWVFPLPVDIWAWVQIIDQVITKVNQSGAMCYSSSGGNACPTCVLTHMNSHPCFKIIFTT